MLSLITLKANEDFSVDLRDEDGFLEKEDGFHVTKGSIWIIEDEDDIEEYRNGGSVYLYEDKDGSGRYLDMDRYFIDDLFDEVD